MKQTIRDEVEELLYLIIAKKSILTMNLEQYLETKNYLDAAKCQIKIDIFETIKTKLEEILK